MRHNATSKRHDGIAMCLHAFFKRHDLPFHLPYVDGERLKPDVEVVGSTFCLDVSLVTGGSDLRATFVQGCIRGVALAGATQDHQLL